MTKYIKKFKSDIEHNSNTGGGGGYLKFRDSSKYITPNVSYCELEKHVHYNKPISVGDFFYSDKTYSTILDTNKTCIGICVIPKNFLPDGRARIMSLKEMDYNNPENGSLEYITMYWGQYGVDTILENLYKVTTIDTNAVDSYDGTTIGKNGYALMPSDRNDTNEWNNRIINNVDNCTWWVKENNNIPYMASPYMIINEKEVLCPQYNSNATSDFNGKYNTKILASLHTIEDWKTSNKITNNTNSNCSTPSVCCSRYKTKGTQSGDWYLPALGELGFIVPRFTKINNSILKLNKQIAITLNNSGVYWSSTEYRLDSVNVVRTQIGRVGFAGKYGLFSARAFLLF